MSNETKDRVVVNMPLLLSVKVLSQQEDGSMVADTEWHKRVLARYSSLFQFLADEHLFVESSELIKNVELAVVRLSDLTDAGQALFKSGAVGKWLASFDRNPSKALDDVRLLHKALNDR